MHGWQKINSNSAPTKQKLFFFHFFRHQSLLPLSSLTRLLLVVTTSLCPILIGFILDSELSMKKHVIKICQTAYFKLKCISSIRRFLTEGATKTLVTFYILSRLDYCNCLLSAHPILSSNLSRKFKTLLQDSSSFYLVITTLQLFCKSCTGFPFQSTLNTKLHACASML